jgi:hypothetical protein
MNQNNLLDVVKFMKENKTFSDFNFINYFMSNLNFTKYRFNNNRPTNTKTGNYSKMIGGTTNMNDSIDTTQVQEQPNEQTHEQTHEQMQSMDPTPVLPLGEQPQILSPINNQNQMIPFIPNNNVQSPDANAQLLLQNDQIQMNPVTNSQMVESIPEPIPEIEELNDEINDFGNETLNIGVNPGAECVYKKIKNVDGTYITQKICGQKIVTMPDMFLPKPTFMYSGTNTYTIKKGTILYHATVHKRGFNTKEIRLGKDKLISFFTPNFRLASDKIEGCSIDKQKGFIHVFEVKIDIPDIVIKLPYDTDEDLNLDELKDKFCNSNEYYKGVGFFYPKNEIELFNNSVFNQRTQEMHENLDDDSYYSEFALCSPNDYLNYLYSQKCMSLRKLSQPYRFDGKNYN